MAPVIFVNNADSDAAQVFTLAHELAHIWIGRGGISDADPTIKSDSPDDIEEYCNDVAAELLLPWGRLEGRWVHRSDALEKWIADVAREFHVSTVMVARQLWENGAIGREEFFRLYEAEKVNWRRPDEAASSGGGTTTSARLSGTAGS
jgi:Zn-dependent peptidase ImmA (M78 family)